MGSFFAGPPPDHPVVVAGPSAPPHMGSFFAGPPSTPPEPPHFGEYFAGPPASPALHRFIILSPPPIPPSPPPLSPSPPASPPHLPDPLPLLFLPISRQPFDPTWEVHNLGQLNIQCPACRALHWLDERLIKSSALEPKFGMCCHSGKISLPALEPPPPELSLLLTEDDPISKSFRDKIRNFNGALALTSVGRKLDDTYNRLGGGPYSFRLQGELIHQIGSLLPAEGDTPLYAQLYIYDSAQALGHRMGNKWNKALSPATLSELQDMLYRSHPAVQLYRQAYELTSAMPPEQQCQIALHFDSTCDTRRYQAPDASVKEIAVILPGDGDQPRGSQDIILYRKSGPLQRISDTHPFYPSLRYVLLFPTGQLGWYPHIL